MILPAVSCVHLTMPRNRDSLAVERPDLMVAALADELPSNAAFASSFGDQL